MKRTSHSFITLIAVVLGWSIDRHRLQGEALQARFEAQRSETALRNAESAIQFYRVALSQARGTAEGVQ
jgi:hypothetical protein